MKNIYFSISIALLFVIKSQAQKGICGTPKPSDEWEKNFSALVDEYKKNNLGAKPQSVAYTIPVIIHVIHGGQAIGTYPNLSAGQLISQIQTLNNDYGGIGYNSWNYPANAFVHWAQNQNLQSANLDGMGRVAIANCNVQFCLATKDTLGNTLVEPGIDRVNYVTKGWNNPFNVTGITTFQNYVNGTIKPGTIWNVRKYLNIWVTDENVNATGGLLGYATFPPGTTLSGLPGSYGTSTTDGFWCYAKCFGNSVLFPNGTYYPNYDKGRTCTHEIGHYLGLRHIWGDGTCASDYCADTPPAAASNAGQPNYPYHTTTCNGSNNPDGEMFMNFMDYVDHPAMYMFSTDQMTRIQTAMATSPYRKFLGTHGLCSVTNMSANALFSVNQVSCGSAVMTLSNMSVGTPIPNYSWAVTGAATFSPNNTNAVSVSFPSPGTYTVTLTASNGTTSVYTKTVSINPLPTLSISLTHTLICPGDSIELNANGNANYYLWQPDGITGNKVRYPADGSYTSFTCLAVGAGNCKKVDSIQIKISDCTGLFENVKNKNLFSIFPNPSKEFFTVKNNSNFVISDLEIVEVSGRIILTKNILDNPEEKISVKEFPSGIYFISLKTVSGVKFLYKVVKE